MNHNILASNVTFHLFYYFTFVYFSLSIITLRPSLNLSISFSYLTVLFDFRWRSDCGFCKVTSWPLQHDDEEEQLLLSESESESLEESLNDFLSFLV